ncbi:MAG TPA: crosslink repair DNA glycosylase YcaQ family protein [Casimicrobiaceae bacterium]
MNAATLRRYAIARTLWRAPTPVDAIARLGFVQYDPIRAPASAQDLILRQRVDGYRAGDLERAYREHPLDETFLHVYGVMPRERAEALHPRGDAPAWRVEREHPGLARRVLRHVRKHGVAHPRTLAQALEATAMVNGWGGASSATTRALDMLQYQGALRVSHRDAGIRVYAPAPKRPRAIGPSRRADTLLAALLALYAPLPAATLRYLAWMVGGRGLDSDERARALARFAKSAGVASVDVDGVRYLYPAGEAPERADVDDRVRALAPFDPIVWDRDRFEHLWGWSYRFEAYTPAAKRVYGYYALPLAWRDRIVGWVNATPTGKGLSFDIGYANGAPRGRAFRSALDDELAALEGFAR